MKSTFMRIFLISLLLTLFIPNLYSAEIKTFIKEYTYRIRIDRESEAIHDLILWLDEPAGI